MGVPAEAESGKNPTICKAGRCYSRSLGASQANHKTESLIMSLVRLIQRFPSAGEALELLSTYVHKSHSLDWRRGGKSSSCSSLSRLVHLSM